MNIFSRTGAQSAVTESDFQVALLHAAWVAPGGRLIDRLAARITLLPQSHHHRYPALEEVSGWERLRLPALMTSVMWGLFGVKVHSSDVGWGSL
jgi:hypothetical protein